MNGWLVGKNGIILPPSRPVAKAYVRLCRTDVRIRVFAESFSLFLPFYYFTTILLAVKSNRTALRHNVSSMHARRKATASYR